MKQLILNNIHILPILLFFNSCSDIKKEIFSENDFRGRVFLSNEYGRSLRAKLIFDDDFNKLKAENIPLNVNFIKEYEILPEDRSPSGKQTISVESWYYFIIKGKDELIYRYYEGSRENEIIFREVYE